VILNAGYLARSIQCGNPSFKLSESPKPGERGILVRRIGWWERNFDWP
jgi:hypothetical protein